MRPVRVVHDYETRSGRPIDDGKMAYLHDKNADIVFLSYKIEEGRVKLWQPGQPIPQCFKNPKGYHYYAFNAQYDWAVTNILGIKYGFGRQSISQVTDIMAVCGRYSYPQALGKADKAMNLSSRKDRRGKALMRKICVPPFDFTPKELVEFGRYCITDTQVLYEMMKALPMFELTHLERKIWEQTVLMNLRGLPIDTAAVTRINQVVTYYTTSKMKDVPRLTDGYVNTTGQIQKIKDYCLQYGVELDNLQKQTVAEVVECDDTPQEVADLLKLRQELSGAAIKKYKRLERMVYKGRIHDNLRYWGAGPGRWSGMGFQAHNLPRASVSNPDLEIKKFYDTTILKEQPLESAKALVRPMIRAPRGKELICADYSSIEYIILMWWAGELEKVEMFRQKICPYKASAALRLGKNYNDITKQERTDEKPVVLGAGYVMGAKGLQSYAEGFGVRMDFYKAQTAINTWRSAHPKVVASWGKLKSCTLNAVRHPGVEYVCNGVSFKVIKDHTGVHWLRMILNSNRSIFYCQPDISEGKYGDVVSHLGLNSTTKQWCKLYLPPNRIIENIIQGLGRDVMASGILNLEDAGFTPIMSVHDEIICEELIGKRSLDQMINLMCLNPLWSGDLPLRADGWVGQRYRK